ncbi:hypothetical protein N7481_008043 [Penicillium waksmanii]|uniref:uncharacterized protein n=1 Tax=Penicillium waksmanii TaxID=69791 RepID=UPI002547A6A3|nr:uncharacterized protein N7481_008043 [Penicillium waksmanii]KAJ5980745.1 hypothetical protein N7481_008043 [Penicillium waksmanii]
MAQQNAASQKQMAKQNATTQKQMAQQNAAMGKQNQHMNHELQAMKHQQQKGSGHGGAGKKVLVGAAVGAAAGVGGVMIYERYREETYVQEQIIRNEDQRPMDQDNSDSDHNYDRNDNPYDYDRNDNDHYRNDNDQYMPQQDENQGEYYNQQDTMDTRGQVQNSGGDGNDGDCCGSCNMTGQPRDPPCPYQVTRTLRQRQVQPGDNL